MAVYKGREVNIVIRVNKPDEDRLKVEDVVTGDVQIVSLKDLELTDEELEKYVEDDEVTLRGRQQSRKDREHPLGKVKKAKKDKKDKVEPVVEDTGTEEANVAKAAKVGWFK